MADPKSPVESRDHAESGEYPSACVDAVPHHGPGTPDEGVALSEGPASCAPPRWPAHRPQCTVAEERHRVKLIGDLSKLLHDPCVPDAAKNAGLTLIGWLARRQPGEDPHAYGVDTAQRARSRRGGR